MRKGRTFLTCATFLAKTGDSTCKKMWNLCICRRTRAEVSGGKPGESKENEKNQFSKLQLMRSIGFLDAKLNPKTLRFDRSIGDTLNCLLKMFCKISFVAKFYVSSLFERENTIQLFIGSLFNFLPTTPRAFLGIVVSIRQCRHLLAKQRSPDCSTLYSLCHEQWTLVTWVANCLPKSNSSVPPKGLIAVSWMVCLHFAFNYLNTKHCYRSFRKWAVITEEMPVEARGEVVGWDEEENERFWKAERKFNRIWNETMTVFFVVLCVMFNSAMFLVHLEVDVYTYLLVQAFQVAHNR